MEKLRLIIEHHGRWRDLEIYIKRIETYLDSDFSQSLENAKALLETISQEICDDRNVELSATDSMNKILKKAFCGIGYSGADLVTQISSSLANIGQQMGNLRNEIGVTSHGKTLEELKERNSRVDEFTRELLIDSTEMLACFLIRGFESEHNFAVPQDIEDTIPEYIDNAEFNDFWDEGFGEFAMGDYSFPASEILYNVDVNAYKTEYDAFNRDKQEGLNE